MRRTLSKAKKLQGPCAFVSSLYLERLRVALNSQGQMNKWPFLVTPLAWVSVDEGGNWSTIEGVCGIRP